MAPGFGNAEIGSVDDIGSRDDLKKLGPAFGAIDDGGLVVLDTHEIHITVNTAGAFVFVGRH